MRLEKMAPEDAVELAKLLQKLDGFKMEDLSKELQAVEDAALSPMDQMVRDLTNSKPVNRKVRGAQRAKPKKQHWKTKVRKRKEYYQSTVKHKRLVKKGELLSTGAEGWWEHIRGHWYQKGYEVEMTKEEWCEIVFPALEGRVPVIRRYNVNAPISLENIYVVESGTQRTVLFDGKEYILRKMGYIL